MVNFTVDQVRAKMDQAQQVRNISVIAHVDHGKSTLTDSLISHAGIIAEKSAGETRFMDTREDEQLRTITIKSTAVSLYFEMDEKDVDICMSEGKTAQTSSSKQKQGKVKPKRDDKARQLKAIQQPECAGDLHVVSELTGFREAPGFKAAPELKAPALPREALSQEVESRQSEDGKTGFLINLIDSPGHLDFCGEVTAALRITDGALVVVDCIEGVRIQTETVLRQAIAERIRPILFVNKLDRAFSELKMDLEEVYQNFVRAIESVNVVIATYKDDSLGDIQLDPSEGTVGFGSGLQAWGFTLNHWAKEYSKKFRVPEKKLMRKLWGDNYFDHDAKKWTSKSTGKNGQKLTRGFVEFILKPIHTVYHALLDGNQEIYRPLLEKLNIKLSKVDSELKGKELVKRVMQSWLPAGDTLLGMIVNHLPSPVVAQKYRVENLYSGPQDDEAAQAIRNCDPKGPLMMYVSKMVPTSEKGRFTAVGRVFSGTIATGQAVRIQGQDYQPGSKKDLYQKKIQRTLLMMGRYVEALPSCPAGNIVGLVGVDKYLLKNGTITTSEHAHNFHSMKFAVSPVVRVAVEPQNPSDLPKLLEGLKLLSQTDPLVQCITAPTGEHIVAGAGELHLEICMKDLREDFLNNMTLRITKPMVSFCEGITKPTDMDCVSKSSNKLNRVYLRAEPLSEDFCRALEKKEIDVGDKKNLARNLVKNFKWDLTDARKIWAFGPATAPANVLVDCTKGVQYLQEIKESIVGGFVQQCYSGVLCGEPLRGFRFNLMDAKIHQDAVHRGENQIAPAAKSAMSAAQIRSNPVLLEPIYQCDITSPTSAMSGVYSTLSQRRGIVQAVEQRAGTPLQMLKAFLPALESFGFTESLRQSTSGQAFPQLIFSHWAPMSGNMYESDDCASRKSVEEVRMRKKLNKELPKFSDYHDKI